MTDHIVALWPFLVLLSFPLMLLVTWAYGKWRPERDGRDCMVYDTFAFALYAAVLCVLASMQMGSADPRSALGLGRLYVPPVVLMIAGLVRNRIVFKSRDGGDPR